MAKLTARARKKIPASKFAGPDRSYPIPDRSHAANAKARASQAVKAGRMSSATEARIDAKANRVLGKGHHSDGHAEGKGSMERKEHMSRTRKEHEHKKPEPKREARAHERAGEKRHMEHKKEGREHERVGMKRAMHKKEEHKGEHGGKVVHVHHHHHTHRD